MKIILKIAKAEPGFVLLSDSLAYFDSVYVSNQHGVCWTPRWFGAQQGNGL